MDDAERKKLADEVFALVMQLPRDAQLEWFKEALSMTHEKYLREARRLLLLC